LEGPEIVFASTVKPYYYKYVKLRCLVLTSLYYDIQSLTTLHS